MYHGWRGESSVKSSLFSILSHSSTESGLGRFAYLWFISSSRAGPGGTLFQPDSGPLHVTETRRASRAK